MLLEGAIAPVARCIARAGRARGIAPRSGIEDVVVPALRFFVLLLGVQPIRHQERDVQEELFEVGAETAAEIQAGGSGVGGKCHPSRVGRVLGGEIDLGGALRVDVQQPVDPTAVQACNQLVHTQARQSFEPETGTRVYIG